MLPFPWPYSMFVDSVLGTRRQAVERLIMLSGAGSDSTVQSQVWCGWPDGWFQSLGSENLRAWLWFMNRSALDSLFTHVTYNSKFVIYWVQLSAAGKPQVELVNTAGSPRTIKIDTVPHSKGSIKKPHFCYLRNRVIWNPHLLIITFTLWTT